MLGTLALVLTLGATHTVDPPLVRATRYELDTRVDLAARRIDGRARITVINQATTPARDVSILLYRLMRASAIRSADGRAISVSQQVVEFEDEPAKQVRQILVRFAKPLRPGEPAALEIEYGGLLRGYTEVGMLYVQDRIDSTYSLIRLDAYAYPTIEFPSNRIRRAAGLSEFDYVARIAVPDGFTVANLGKLDRKASVSGWTTFEYHNLRPAWRMDFGVARYGLLEHDDLHVFYVPEDSAGARRLLSTMERTLALYNRWFGERSAGASFSVMEIPEGWGSQADVTGILQTASAFKDSTRDYELYHELSHLWNVKSKDPVDPRWNEGLATFIQDVTTDTLLHTATTDSAAARTVRSLKRRLASDTALVRTPMMDFGRKEMIGHSYRVGALMFYVLYRTVGHDAFCRTIARFYRDYQASGATSAAFVHVAQQESGMDLSTLFETWLFTTRWTDVTSRAGTVSELVQLSGVRP